MRPRGYPDGRLRLSRDGRLPHNAGVTAPEPAILAIDLGTSETKAALVTASGRIVGAARAPYPTDVDSVTGRAEQDPEGWWAALASVCARLAAAAPGSLAAVCVVGQGPTMAPVDAGGRATHPALTWLDTRPVAEAPGLEAATGLAGWGLGILPAARWLERHAPDAAAATRWYLNSWEWAVLRLTGNAVTTRSLGQVLPDPSRAARAGLVADRVAPIAAAGSVVGVVTARAARTLGIPVGIPVVTGTVDSFASFHGAGLLEAGDAVDTGGTSGGLAVYWDAPVEVPGAWVAAAPLPDRWIVGGAMTATGKALDWFDESVLAGGHGSPALIDAAAAVPPGAGGILFLPYLAGERSPIWDPLARGAFVGLTLAHGQAHLARAILEAAALALRHVAEPILATGLRIDELRVAGGTARGNTWNQIKADVLGVPVAVPAARETAVLGAGILAAVAIGWHADPRAAIRAMVRIDHRLEPDSRTRATYDALFEAYRDLWPAVASVAHRLHDLPTPR